ncbi:tRNA-(ms[2]io[6]A)-hydroxylase [Pseudomaricurvus sp.]|uniref:tRNA-(ms[2]io[6]A)-hydroxylase n=1 Tax=Pseudomaricurvus sp. TaxID=2004510 RepID=UPI003F6AB1FD
MSAVSITPVLEFLRCRTPQVWIDRALEELEVVLLDHAANELKAAQSAMTMMAKNPSKIDLLNKMSRLAREELVHFEQALKILKKRGIVYRPLKASTYASKMSKHIRKEQRENFIDTLIVGSIIEARSCERFDALAPHLDAELNKFYLSLLKSEARHFKDYLTLAQSYADEDIQPRVDFFLDEEEKAITLPDKLFRLHSGLPVEPVFSQVDA